ncbi:Fc.00g072670.m01.CDS01 [Cosmosporella sp. VM-42]
MTVLILFTSGFTVFTKANWSTVGFISAYLDIPLVLAAHLIWKFLKKTQVVSLSEAALDDVFLAMKKDLSAEV